MQCLLLILLLLIIYFILALPILHGSSSKIKIYASQMFINVQMLNPIVEIFLNLLMDIDTKWAHSLKRICRI